MGSTFYFLFTVTSVKHLGVVVQDKFKMDMQVNCILSQCNQRMYLLKSCCALRDSLVFS